jgi:acetyl esterase/lipase
MIDADFHLPKVITQAQPRLDPQNEAFIDAGAKAGGPPLESLSYAAARAVLECLQIHVPSTNVARSELSIPDTTIKSYIYKPTTIKADGVLKTIFYFHGGGWILGSPKNTRLPCPRFSQRNLRRGCISLLYTCARSQVSHTI